MRNRIYEKVLIEFGKHKKPARIIAIIMCLLLVLPGSNVTAFAMSIKEAENVTVQETSELPEETSEDDEQDEVVEDIEEFVSDDKQNVSVEVLDEDSEEAIETAEEAADLDEFTDDSSTMPEFSDMRTVDGVVITVSAPEGVFPEGATLSVSKAKKEEQQDVDNAVDKARDENVNVAASYTYDIKVLDKDGNEIQPADGQKVNVSFTLEKAENENLTADVYHITEENGELSAEALDITEEGQAVIAESDGFSYYTVEFTYDEKQYVMQGDSSVALTDILSFVGITKADGNTVADSDITAVSVSNESLFSASNEGGEWTVTAQQAFTSEEWMKVTVEGVEYEIVVTDDQPAYIINKNGYNYIEIDNMVVGQTVNFSQLRTDYEISSIIYDYYQGTPFWIYKDNNLLYNFNQYYASVPGYFDALFDGNTYTVTSVSKSASGGYLYVETKTAEAGSISYANTSVSKTFGNASFTNELTKTGDGTVTYSSGNTSVATVNSSTGQVTIVGAGSATITATVADTDNYTYETKTASYTLTVSRANISPTVTMSGWTYGATASNPSVTGNSGNGEVSYEYKVSTAADSTYTSTKPSDAGTYTVKAIIAQTTNYNSGTATINFTISKATNPVTYANQTWNYTYATTAQTKTLDAATNAQGTVTYSLQSRKNSSTNANVTYFTFNASSRVLTAAAETPAGTYTVVVRASAAGNGNYNEGYKDSTITVTVGKAASTAPTLTAYSGTYDKSAHSIDVTGGNGGTIKYSTDNLNWNTTNPTRTDAGTTTVYVKVFGDGNHNDSATVNSTITINQKEVGLEWSNTSFTYDGNSHKPTATATGLCSGDTCTVDVSGEQTNFGTYTATASSLSNTNYKLPSANTTSFTIGKKALTITANNQTITYGNPIATGAANATADGLANGDTLTGVTLTASTSEATANGKITPSDATIKRGNTDVTSNYQISYADGTLVISKAVPVVTVPVANDLTYDGTEQVLIAQGSTTGGTLMYSLDNESWTDDCSLIKGKSAGTYTVYYKVAGNNNYEDVDVSSLDVTIKKKISRYQILRRRIRLMMQVQPLNLIIAKLLIVE